MLRKSKSINISVDTAEDNRHLRVERYIAMVLQIEWSVSMFKAAPTPITYIFNILSHSFYFRYKLMKPYTTIHLWLRRTCSSDTTTAEDLCVSEDYYSLKKKRSMSNRYLNSIRSSSLSRTSCIHLQEANWAA